MPARRCPGIVWFGSLWFPVSPVRKLADGHGSSLGHGGRRVTPRAERREGAALFTRSWLTCSTAERLAQLVHAEAGFFKLVPGLITFMSLE